MKSTMVLQDDDFLICLTSEQIEEKKRLEEIIRRNPGAFYVVGAALYQIREEKLYENKFATFEEYCWKRWEISKAHAHRLVAAAS